MVQTTEAHPPVKGWSGTVKGSDGAFAGPMFSSSASSLQSVTIPRPRQADQETQAQQKPQASGPVFGKSSHESQGFVSRTAGRVTNMFRRENLVSTFMTIGFIKSWMDKTLGAFGSKHSFSFPAIPGMEKTHPYLFGKNFKKENLVFSRSQGPETTADKIMALSILGGLIQNVAFLLTKRGGEIPEGKNNLEKAVNSIKHPDKHSVHFSTATMGSIVVLIGANRVFNGTKGLHSLHANNKMDFKSDDFRGHAANLVAGLAGMAFAPMAFFGLFKIKDKKNKEDKPDQSRNTSTYANAALMKEPAHREPKPGLIKHVKEVISYAVKHDKMGVTGRGLSQIIEMGFIVNGLLELKKDPTKGSAYNTVKGGLAGMVLNAANFYFIYDRMLTNSKKQGAAPAR